MAPTLAELAADTAALRDHGLAGLRQDVSALMHQYALVDPSQVAAGGGEPAELDEVRDRLAELHRILILADASAGQLAAHSQRLADRH